MTWTLIYNTIFNLQFSAGEAKFRKYQYNDKQFKLLEPMDHGSLINEAQVSVDFFGKYRHKKALLGWRSILEPLEKQLLKNN